MPATATLTSDNAAETYRKAITLVVSHQKASTSWLQRQLRIGYNVAASLIERMERQGIVSAPNHVGARDVLASTDIIEAADNDDQADYCVEAPFEPAPPVVKEESAATENAASRDLRELIERIRRLKEEQKGIADDIKDVFLEAKSRGYDTKGMKAIITLMDMDPSTRLESQAIIETYKSALGMD